jgi:uncharacterized damage-inducible protein DinB
MKLTEYLLDEMEREIPGTRQTLERVPEGNNDWVPHAKSMPLGNLANLCATMFSWIELIINTEELDIAPAEGAPPRPPLPKTRKELTAALDDAVAKCRKALSNTTDEHLKKDWTLLARGKVMQKSPRYVMISDTYKHLAHHRGQLTVYLRLNNASVPAIYGPSADEGKAA